MALTVFFHQENCFSYVSIGKMVRLQRPSLGSTNRKRHELAQVFFMSGPNKNWHFCAFPPIFVDRLPVVIICCSKPPTFYRIFRHAFSFCSIFSLHIRQSQFLNFFWNVTYWSKSGGNRPLCPILPCKSDFAPFWFQHPVNMKLKVSREASLYNIITQLWWSKKQMDFEEDLLHSFIH